MEPKTYRVELFITPLINGPQSQTRSIISTEKYVSEIGLDIIQEVSEQEIEEEEEEEEEQMLDKNNKEKQENEQEENTKSAVFMDKTEINKEASNLEKEKNFCNFDDHIYDEPFVGNCSTVSKKNLSLIKDRQNRPVPPISRFSQRYLPRPPKRTSSLKSIDESMEILEQSFQDICYHGHKNGCTVAAQKPEEVSQEIFRENWLQKLESLRQREALLRDKELALQSQERLLFKKERQLRILERLVQDKMKQAELYLKRCKNLPGFENLFEAERSSESGFSHSSRGSRSETTKDSEEVKSSDSHIYDEINMKNPPNSISSLVAMGDGHIVRNQTNMNCIKTNKFSIHNSFRLKQKPKISYSDLDSTLSADVGDSSFAVTSTKFNPDIFKKPIAFMKSTNDDKLSGFSTLKTTATGTSTETSNHHFEETKILKKFSDNIMVSQNKETKFQNYGLIDKSSIVNSASVKSKISNEPESSTINSKNSYCSLDCNSNSKSKSSKRSKGRPNSWNAENDDWLKRKRQEYNMSMRRVTNKLHNKENNEMIAGNEKPAKPPKKKENKSRKFMIFR